MCGFVAVATEWLITHHCLLSILDGLDFMFGEKHWTRGAIKYLGTLMEGMVDYQRPGDLQFEEICWNWSCCRFTWQSRRVSEIASCTEQGGSLGYSVLDAGLSFGRRGLVSI